MSFLVLEKHGEVSVQGLPQAGRRKFGVPPGGAFDLLTAGKLNVLLGNPPEALEIEVALAHLKLVAEAEIVLAWSGCHTNVRIDGRRALPETALKIAEGQILEFDYPKYGARLWLAVSGGFMNLPGALIQKTQLLSSAPPTPVTSSDRNTASGFFDAPTQLDINRVDSSLPIQETYMLQVDARSDRRGIRLTGSGVTHRIELPSCPTSVGAVQLTPDGTMIIIGPDGPTIGGYPQIGWIDELNLAKVAQLRPGDEVTLMF